MTNDSQVSRKLAVESVVFGVGYAAVLIWIGSALVASFTGNEALPYWAAIPFLRTDTAGDLAMVVAIITLVVSRYMQLRRRGAPPRPVTARPADRPASLVLLQAVAEIATILCTGVVVYLSFNEVTHPETLELQLTHLLPGPTEGTVRVLALAICLVSVAVSRYLRASAPRPGQTPAVPENSAKADVAV